MSQVSRGHLSFLDPSVDHLIDLVEALAQFGVVQNSDGNDLCECKTERCASPASSLGNGESPGSARSSCASAAGAGDKSSGPGSCRQGLYPEGQPSGRASRGWKNPEVRDETPRAR